MAVEFVEVVHPDVEDVGLVPKSALGQYARQGWRPKSEVDAELAEAAEKNAPPANKSSKEK